MSRFHQILALLLSFGIIASTTTAALSQGRMAGSYDITICSPDGVHEITLGLDGKPTNGGHDCQECCFFFADGLPEEDTLPPPNTNGIISNNVSGSHLCSRTSFRYIKARAPPYLV